MKATGICILVIGGIIFVIRVVIPAAGCEGEHHGDGEEKGQKAFGHRADLLSNNLYPLWGKAPQKERRKELQIRYKK